MDRLLRVLDYRAKIAGLYAPVRQQVGVEVRAEVSHRKLEAVKILESVAEEAVAIQQGSRDDD